MLKKIIFAAPLHYNLSQLIKHELESMGFEVCDISFFGKKYNYKSSLDRIKNLFYKTTGIDKAYKTFLQFQENKNWIQEKLQSMPKADYCLIIRPDVFPSNFLKEIITKCDKSVAYQWDGLHIYPHTMEKIDLFDDFFVFDKNDLDYPHTKLTTNFYPEAIQPIPCMDVSDVYYTGTYTKSRIATLKHIIGSAQQIGLKLKYILYCPKRRKNSSSLLKTSKVGIDYETNISNVANSKVIIDIINPNHTGLSFRTFEAIGFRKKLITNYKSVKNYDFYHPNNILIWETSSNAQDLINFYKTPYHALDAHIHLKYGFNNWIKYMLDIKPYIPIASPR